MATTTHVVTFKGSVSPSKTKFLEPKPIVMDFSGDLELDETDASNLSKIQKAFQDDMGKRLKAQVGHLNSWLGQKDKMIAGMVKKYGELKKQGLPKNSGDAASRAKTLKELEAVGTQIEKLEAEFQQIVKDWAKNAREQQGLISMMEAVKKARLKNFNNKNWRVRAGQALKVALVVVGIALSIAAIVVTAGATAPVFIALASAGAAIAGISSIADVASSIKKNASVEQKILASVQKEVKTIESAMKPLNGSNSNIAKHITELRNLMKIRQDSIRKVDNELQKMKAEIAGYAKALVKLQNDNSVPKSDVKKQADKIRKLNKDVVVASGEINRLKADNAKGEALLTELRGMNVQLDKLSGQSSNTLAGNLKERFSSLDGWTDLGNNLGGIVSGASGIQP